MVDKPYSRGSLTLNWEDGVYKVFPIFSALVGIRINKRRPSSYSIIIKPDTVFTLAEREMLTQWEHNIKTRVLAHG